MTISTPSLRDVVVAVRTAAQALALTPASTRNAALLAIATAIETHQAEILAANAKDLAAAAVMVSEGSLGAAAYARLKLSPSKIATMAAGVRDVAKLADPVGASQWRRELDTGLILERRTYPLGVLAVIFESRPDAVPQIASLALKTGNGVVLKGGREALHSCQCLSELILQALNDSQTPPALHLLTTRAETEALLSLDQLIDLVIPRGSNSFVRYVQTHTQIPVLGHADGICHLYVDQAANLEQAVALTVDSKVQYPAACNALETLLVHAAIAPTFLPQVAATLRAVGVEMRGCEQTRALIEAIPATELDWQTEYGDLVLAIRIVSDLEAALQHIQTYGSRHTEAIATEDTATAASFLDRVDAAGVFHNASTRFSDGFRYGFGAEVGISTQKMPPRGPVGLEGLVTYKYRLVGAGHCVATYSGEQARSFTHRDL
ncbi:MAG: glutamate-5-semialdehyde dehydrogenase [Synechococcaceae cyanobacterium SM2_3_60]|nr:glutamate-5-semialdehyde dehydrogenase [Synechococcaceae cyanobacterium SM2_3_60]